MDPTLELTLQWIRYFSSKRLFDMSARRFASRVGRSARSVERDFEELADLGKIFRRPAPLRKRRNGTYFKRRRFEVVSELPVEVLARQTALLAKQSEGKSLWTSYLRKRLLCTDMQASAALKLAQQMDLVRFAHVNGHLVVLWAKPVEVEPPVVPPKPPKFVALKKDVRRRYIEMVRKQCGGEVPPHDEAASRLGVSVTFITRLVRALKVDGLITGSKQHLVMDMTKVDPRSPAAQFGKAIYEPYRDDIDTEHGDGDAEDDDGHVEPVFEFGTALYDNTGEEAYADEA